jgi:8-oxoguanine DNA glycosylase-like protein
MTISNYCLTNIHTIQNNVQESFSWTKYDNPILRELSDYDELITNSEIPVFISRNDIINAFKNKEYYKAYILCMLWGGIGLQPKANTHSDRRTTNAYLSFSLGDIVISEYLGNLDNLIANESYESAYKYLESGRYKIKGIGVSYFTKLLCFLDASHNQKLLIYDKWTKLIHILLMYDTGIDPMKFYTKVSIEKLYNLKKDNNPTELISTKQGQSFNAYINYCESMESLSQVLSNHNGKTIVPLDIEGFLFGKKLMGENKLSINNPRVWLRNKMKAKLHGLNY